MGKKKIGVAIRASKVLGPTEKIYDGKKLQNEPLYRLGTVPRHDCNGVTRLHPVIEHQFTILWNGEEIPLWSESYYHAQQFARQVYGPTAKILPLD